MRYERPAMIKTYSLAQLRADAAACTAYYPMPTVTSSNFSDERLKTDIEPI
jgi:hypothetical protein